MNDQARTAPRKPVPQNKTGTLLASILGCLVAAIVAASPVFAQDINETVTIEDLGFTSRIVAGSRPMALAGAYAAVSKDVHALIYNPAALVGVVGTQVDLGFQHRRSTLENTFYGSLSQVNASNTTLDDLAFAYSVPTVRGRLVIAGGIYQAYSSEINILNRGFNEDTSTDDDYLLQQNGSTYSYNLGGAVDLAPKLSVGANLFFLHGRVNALTQFSYAFVPPPPATPRDLESETLVDDAVVDINGVGAVVGFLYQPVRAINIGVAVGTPTPIYLRGDAVQSDALYFSSPPDSFITQAFVIDSDYKLPFYAELGAAFSSGPLLLSGEVEYWNWEEAEINGRQIKDGNLRTIFKNVVNYRVGGELTLGVLSLRGGYAYTPYPLEYLQADRIEGTQITPAVIADQPLLHNRWLNNNQQSITAGMGLLFADVFRLDISVEHQHGKRRIPTLVDERDLTRVVFAASVGI